jgi:septal ring-binding cell division protein DamX
MDESNKLFVFEKKEVILIFLFIVVIAVISFTLGVRVGKGLSLKEDSYTGQDLSTINLKSMDEEYVESVVEKKKKDSDFESSMKDSSAGVKAEEGSAQGDMEQRLREEMEKLATEEVVIEKVTPKAKTKVKVEPKKTIQDTSKKDDMYNQENDFSGKYTIQLYSNQSKEVAQDFADGFIAKGYDVIVNEAAIPGKGVWYRVSIGVFGNMNEAKDYLDKEKAIFQDSKYLIQQF